MRHTWPIAILVLLAACEETPPGAPSEGPLLRAAIAELDRVRGEALDRPFDDPAYDAVIDAFEAVPEGTPDRSQAESWVLWLEAKRREARERHRRLAEEVMAPADSYKAFLERRAAADAAAADAAASDADAMPAESAAAPAVAAEVDRLGRGREFWYQRGQQFATRLDELEQEAADQREYTRRVCSRYEMEACAHAKLQLAELERDCEKAAVAVQRLKDDARRNGVPPGWLRRPGADPPPLGEPIARPPEEVDNQGRGERYWQDRKRGLLDRIARLQPEVAEAQAQARDLCADPGSPSARPDDGPPAAPELNARSVDLSSVSHRPGTIDSTVGVRLECTRAVERHAKLKAALDRARDELAALEDEARRAGALPGWIR